MEYKIPYSQGTKLKARGLHLTVEELAFCDLVACHWNRRDAYILSHNCHTISDEAIDRNSREICARPLVKERIAELRGKVVTNDPEESASDEDVQEALSKENTLKELYFARKKTKNGSKEWLEITKLIADITRMKQEEIKNEDTTVHFYLPLTCSRCRLKKDYDSKRADK